MTDNVDIAKLLACSVYQLGGSLEISRELLDTMKPVRLVLDTDNPSSIKISVLSNEILLGDILTEKSPSGMIELAPKG